jgi:prepilin-type N-terminal cleavage/methylation domain-containing protein
MLYWEGNDLKGRESFLSKKMIKNKREGFTLIEILIVVAIIAILASVILVGLGPTQSLGRDARRLSDLHEVQNGLELYYNKSGAYPVVAGGAWATLTTDLTGAGIGVNSVPNDPTSGDTYQYGSDGGGTTYIVGAVLENGTGGQWNNYSPPGNLGNLASADTDVGKCTVATKNFCLTL